MSIEIFEKALPSARFYVQTVVDLLHDAGFADVALDGATVGNYHGFKSDSGVYGCKTFKMYAFNLGSDVVSPKLIAVKDESLKSLIIFCNINHVNTVSYECSYFSLIIVDGTCVSGAGNPFSDCGVTRGEIKGASDVSEAKLVPFMDRSGDTHEPFYVSMNRVNHNINTVVTDGVNSFTSLGNLFYIKNA